MPSNDILINKHASATCNGDAEAVEDNKIDLVAVTRFHQQVLPGYAPTPLHEIDLRSSRDGARSSHSQHKITERFKGRVYIKDESNRYGLPAFKVLGAAYASYVALCEAWKLDVNSATLSDLRTYAAKLAPTPALVAATDGNHGRAVAFFANLIGVHAQIFIPWTVEGGAERAISGEGPRVKVVRLKEDYDEAVRRAAAYASEETGSQDAQERHLIQDTAWEGYTYIPQKIVHGYQTIFREIEDELNSLSRQAGDNMPLASAPFSPDVLPQTVSTHVICPVGVGSLAQAVVEYYAAAAAASRSESAPGGSASHTSTASPSSSSLPSAASTTIASASRRDTSIITVEPRTAACLSASLAAGEITEVKTAYTVMPGLNCGTPSLAAWPHLKRGIAAAVQIDDADALECMRWLSEQKQQRTMSKSDLSGDGKGIESGPCGAAPLAALRVLLAQEDKAEQLGLLDREDVKVVLLMTEGTAPA